MKNIPEKIYRSDGAEFVLQHAGEHKGKYMLEGGTNSYELKHLSDPEHFSPDKDTALARGEARRLGIRWLCPYYPHPSEKTLQVYDTENNKWVNIPHI